jgi:hypothetical protein
VFQKVTLVFVLCLSFFWTDTIGATEGNSQVVGLPYANLTESELESVIANGAISLEPGSELTTLVNQLYPFLTEIRGRYGNTSVYLVASFVDTNSPNNAGEAVPYIFVDESVTVGTLPLRNGDIFFMTGEDTTGYLEPWNMGGFTDSASLIIPLIPEYVDYLNTYAPELKVDSDVEWIAVNLVGNAMVTLPVSIVGTIDGLPNAPTIALPENIYDFRIDPGWYPEHFHVVLIDMNSLSSILTETTELSY